MIEDTKGRYKMVEILANFLSSVLLLNPDDLLSCIYLSINQLAPAYEGNVINIMKLNEQVFLRIMRFDADLEYVPRSKPRIPNTMNSDPLVDVLHINSIYIKFSLFCRVNITYIYLI